jgi:hypothetical protein
MYAPRDALPARESRRADERAFLVSSVATLGGLVLVDFAWITGYTL